MAFMLLVGRPARRPNRVFLPKRLLEDVSDNELLKDYRFPRAIIEELVDCLKQVQVDLRMTLVQTHISHK